MPRRNHDSIMLSAIALAIVMGKILSAGSSTPATLNQGDTATQALGDNGIPAIEPPVPALEEDAPNAHLRRLPPAAGDSLHGQSVQSGAWLDGQPKAED